MVFWELLAGGGLVLFLSVLGVGTLIGLAWAVKILRHYLCCCCCGRRAGPAEPHVGPSPPVPAAAAALPSVEVHRGYFDPEFAGPDATRAADTEFYQRKIRGMGAGRKPNDVLIKMPAGAARLQPDWEGGSRIDRTGLTVSYSRVLGATDRRLREELERNQCIHLCRSQDCSNPALLHCKAYYAAADSEALVDLGAYGRFGPGSSLAVWAGGCSGSYVMESSSFGRGPMARRPSRGSAPRQIQEQGVLRTLDPNSESEAEVVEDPCQAVQGGLELQGVTKALSVEDCNDRAASEPTRLLDRDQELSDLGGSSVARLWSTSGCPLMQETSCGDREKFKPR